MSEDFLSKLDLLVNEKRLQIITFSLKMSLKSINILIKFQNTEPTRVILKSEPGIDYSIYYHIQSDQCNPEFIQQIFSFML